MSEEQEKQSEKSNQPQLQENQDQQQQNKQIENESKLENSKQNREQNESENQNEKQIQKDSQEAIREVFNKFDKDGNGTIDFEEIGALSKELGAEINEEEIIKIFQELDDNNDGKIDFYEFWNWWSYYGESKGDLSVKLQALLEHPDGENLINKIGEIIDLDTKNKDKIAFILRFKAQDGKQNDLISKLKQTIEEIKDIIGEIMGPTIVTMVETLDINVIPFEENWALLYIKVDEELVSDYIQQKQVQKLKGMIEKAQLKLECRIGLKNSLQQMFDQPEKKFIKSFLEGFLIEGKIEMNKGFLNHFRQLIHPILAQKRIKKWNEQFALLSLIYATKFHLQFKDIDNVEEFLEGLGLSEITKNQPTNEEMIKEIFVEEFIDSGRDGILTDKESPVPGIIKKFEEIGVGQIQFECIFQNNYINLEGDFRGIGDIYKMIMKELKNQEE
ncbi:hypothetical protein PPERSA_08308 [Pseudocohnilembus persalinus]|uniref:EF-hand domain-containing protein n=1 Tax=Pseudocohnilembus persalinus TaxID=266149 RepID=A0A0V0QPJ8_PSEPJ|nr:hypothetical protein PPERSA_08308 [Pseudocohnilembus persalinus]|eukprot:KRX04093.1 hypothetical protein PPERSA_08308 [Pseudocohnilembus persalinus]